MGEIKRKVLVLYVGGTIGMQKNEYGVYMPVPDAFVNKIKSTSEMHDAKIATKYKIDLNENELILPNLGPNLIIYRIKEYHPLLDSSNMATKEWIRIAEDIKENYSKFDGFVVLHGTDTLAYTSSALSFMLENLQKPVIITGSQIPVFESRSDAKENFLSSLIFAGCYNIPEVCVFFANKLLRGNRTTKVSSNCLDAFDSPNYHPLATTGIEVNLHYHYIAKRNSSSKFSVHTNLSSNVGRLTFYPTIASEQLESFLKPPIEGIVLQSYGAGNISSNRTDLLKVLKTAVDRGVVIINITQCSKGSVSVTYEAGKALEQLGIISGGDMTAEATLTKLAYILAMPCSYESRVKLMKSNLRGELSSAIFKYHNNNEKETASGSIATLPSCF
ncbi:L-asparaginase isoform X2 [Cylas formicarius]|uniref:L-asparaginase isoform X2 n=1 Tax=Cylas formicarius TaxID=197179 RepID=UPI00295861DD|nr:L-asparaginase isoform X2 [Cylas formicarius]